jgi:hypothetical protein
MRSNFQRFSIFLASLAVVLGASLFLRSARGSATVEGSARASETQQDGSAQTDVSPVLVELFTSEGCSSCPPADALLRKLDSLQPVKGVQAIVLSEHVDYWNHDGWEDAYSSRLFTERQTNYVRRLAVADPYTPQMVLDGVAQMNGSDAGAVTSALEKARGRAKVALRISSAAVEGKTVHLHLVADALPESARTGEADIFVATALSRAQSHVSAGENQGRDLSHVAVAETIQKVGTVEKGKSFERDVTIAVKSPPDLANLRLIGFVQESDTGPVLGATLVSAPIQAVKAE